MSPTAREILDYLGIDPPSAVSRRRFLELFGGEGCHVHHCTTVDGCKKPASGFTI